jgi:heme exporter protein A
MGMFEGPVFEGAGLVCVRGGRRVFTGLDFAVGGGEILWLKGSNGCGKTSLLRLMAGLLPAAAGKVSWDGQPIADDPEAHAARLHYLGHRNAVKPELTVAENLAFWAGLGEGGAGAGERAEDALRRFGLARFADVPGRFLSAGQRRRLAAARLLATPAELWLLDEPGVSLDEEALAVLTAVIEEHRAGGGIVVFASHAGLAIEGAGVLDLRGHPPAASADRESEGVA